MTEQSGLKGDGTVLLFSLTELRLGAFKTTNWKSCLHFPTMGGNSHETASKPTLSIVFINREVKFLEHLINFIPSVYSKGSSFHSKVNNVPPETVIGVIPKLSARAHFSSSFRAASSSSARSLLALFLSAFVIKKYL